jgi:hypothetical protein
MNEIEELQLAYISYKRSDGQLKDCVDWAVERLVRDEDEGDEEIIQLASSPLDWEIDQLVHNILRKYLGSDAENEEYWVGQLLIRLYDRYQSKSISIMELDPIFWSLLNNLWPSGHWLVQLCRNCEYATDVDAFLKPFEDEFKYITDLWREANSLGDFLKKYERQISNSHEAEFLKRNRR